MKAHNVEIIGDLNYGTGAAVSEFSTDGTLAGNSDNVVPTEQAVKTYADTNFLGISAKAADSELLDAQEGAYYQNAGNLNAGTILSARLTGTYAISISGLAATATLAADSSLLESSNKAYYRDAGN